jgi:hypothetical protein
VPPPVGIASVHAVYVRSVSRDETPASRARPWAPALSANRPDPSATDADPAGDPVVDQAPPVSAAPKPLATVRPNPSTASTFAARRRRRAPPACVAPSSSVTVSVTV